MVNHFILVFNYKLREEVITLTDKTPKIKIDQNIESAIRMSKVEQVITPKMRSEL